MEIAETNVSVHSSHHTPSGRCSGGFLFAGEVGWDTERCSFSTDEKKAHRFPDRAGARNYSIYTFKYLTPEAILLHCIIKDSIGIFKRNL
jgi:hypothetical protein